MRVFKDLDLVEQMGSGILRILEVYGKECFEFSDNFVVITLPKGGQVGGQVPNITEAQKKVLALIVENPSISRAQISEKLDINQSAVQKHLESLKEQQIIERVGETNGHWKIIRVISNKP